MVFGGNGIEIQSVEMLIRNEGALCNEGIHGFVDEFNYLSC